MNECPGCGEMADTAVCPTCFTPILSYQEDKVDEMIATASAPNLATLFDTAKSKGLIAPQQEYGHPSS